MYKTYGACINSLENKDIPNYLSGLSGCIKAIKGDVGMADNCGSEELEKQLIAVLDSKDKAIESLQADERKEILKEIQKLKIVEVKNQSGSIKNSMKILVEDIYKDGKMHCFFELIQNADDASRDIDGAELTIRLTEEDQVVFEYTDRGFNFQDVYAITSIGSSTKKTIEKLEANAPIGEKGLGFKSVFGIAENVGIESKNFSFAISHEEKMGFDSIFIPLDYQCQGQTSGHNKTKITLTLREDLKENLLKEISRWMKEKVQYIAYDNPFLFLNNICKVTYVDKENNPISIHISRESIGDSISLLILNDHLGGAKEYIVVSETMEFGEEDIKSRWPDIDMTEDQGEKDIKIERQTEVAFPILLNEKNKEINGRIYSYLPTNIILNFPVFINLDVHLTASRGNITTEDFAKDSTWNTKIEKNLPDFLLAAYRQISGGKYDNEKIRALRDSFHYYIPIEKQLGMYEKPINQFIEEIKKEPIILTNNNTFAKVEDVRLVLDKVKESTSDFINSFDAKTIENLYNFMGESKNNSDMITYPKNQGWNQLLYKFHCGKSLLSKGSYDVYEIVVNEKGFRSFWTKNQDEQAKVIIENIIEKLFRGSQHIGSKTEGVSNISIIPIETKDGFELKSIDSLGSIAVFLHSDNREIEDKTNSVYVATDHNSFKGISNLLGKIYGIARYDLPQYYKKCVADFIDSSKNDPLNKSDFANLFIDKTFLFFKDNPNCYNIAEQMSEVKDFFATYTLPWNDLNKSGIVLCENYIDKLNELFVFSEGSLKLENWTITSKYLQEDYEATNAYLRYLIFLGLKCKIEFVDDKEVGTQRLDKYSEEIMSNFAKKGQLIEIDSIDRTLKLEEYPLKTYFLEEVDKRSNEISVEYLISFCNGIGFFQTDHEKCSHHGKEVVFASNKDIVDINNKIKDLKGEEKPQINDSNMCMITTEYFNKIIEKISIKNENDSKIPRIFLLNEKKGEIIYQKKDNGAVTTIVGQFINSFSYPADQFIKALQMLDILNRVFFNKGPGYMWGTGEGEKPLGLSLAEFLSCYKQLNGDEELGKLMAKGYTVTGLDKFDAIESSFEKYNGYDDLKHFLKSLESLNDRENLLDLLANFLIIDENLLDTDYICFGNENKTETTRYLIRNQKKMSDIIFNIFYAMNDCKLIDEKVKFSLIEKKMIKDYFGELDLQKPLIPIESNAMGHPVYYQGVFFHRHQDNLEKAKNKLESIWDKNILERLSAPFALSDGSIMEGYGYTCPICGKQSLCALSGIKFKRFKHSNNGENPYLYIVSCLNCNEMLTYAKELRILDFDEVLESFNHSYCADDKHIKNHSKMLTAKLQVVTWDGKTQEHPMKISYVNMVLYKKLSRKKS